MPRVTMFTGLEISGTGLAAQRARMNAIARNIANAGTTKTETGEPYRRQEVVIESIRSAEADEAVTPKPLVTGRDREAGEVPEPPRYGGSQVPVVDVPGGVRVAGLRDDETEFPMIYEPGHPEADENGYVKMPNVNMINEMVDMMMAARAYEANLSAMNSTRDLLMKTLSIGKP